MLTVRMTRLLFPFILFVSLAAAVMGMLNARRYIFGLSRASASTVFNYRLCHQRRHPRLYFLEPQKTGLHPHFGEKAVFGWCFSMLIGTGLRNWPSSSPRFGESALISPET